MFLKLKPKSRPSGGKSVVDASIIAILQIRQQIHVRMKDNPGTRTHGPCEI